MPKLPGNASKKEKRDRMAAEMHKWKAGEMHSGTGKKGEKRGVVRKYDQAIAIALSESGQSKKRGKRKSSRSASRGGRR